MWRKTNHPRLNLEHAQIVSEKPTPVRAGNTHTNIWLRLYGSFCHSIHLLEVTSTRMLMAGEMSQPGDIFSSGGGAISFDGHHRAAGVMQTWILIERRDQSLLAIQKLGRVTARHKMKPYPLPKTLSGSKSTSSTWSSSVYQLGTCLYLSRVKR
jgi:hypothetical protein